MGGGRRSRSVPAGTAARCPSRSWVGSSAQCSHPGDLVLDPFGGTGTTLVVAKELGRRFLGSELSPDNAAAIYRRRDETHPDHALSGGPEPSAGLPRPTQRTRRNPLFQ